MHVWPQRPAQKNNSLSKLTFNFLLHFLIFFSQKFFLVFKVE